MSDLPRITISAEPQHSNQQVSWNEDLETVKQNLLLLHRKDKSTEKKAFYAVLIAFLSFAAFLVMLFVVNDLNQVSVLLLVLGVVFLSSLVSALLLKRKDMDDRKLGFAWGLLEAMGPELARKRKVRLELDFRACEKSPDKSLEWLRMSLPLLDGCVANVYVTTAVSRKTRRKRKYTKIKDKIHENVLVELRMPRGRSVPDGAADALTSFFERYDGPLTLRRARIKPRSLVAVLSTPVVQRVRGRYGWTAMDLDRALVDPARIVHTLQAAYYALRQAGAAAG